MPAYLAEPTTPGSQSNVIVGFEMFGVSSYIRSVTDRIAGLGYRAVAPDFYHRLGTRGHIAYYAATQVPLAALAVFYPGWLTDPGIALSRPEPTLNLSARIAEFSTPVLFLVGDGDHLFTGEQRAEIVDRLRNDGVNHEMVVYPDTPHGFFCHERDSYRKAAADDAFERLTRLLADKLSPQPGASGAS